MRRFLGFAAALLLLAGCGSGGGSSGTTVVPPPPPPPPPSVPFFDPVAYSSAPSGSLPSAQELSSITRGTVTVNGAALDYTATTGHLTARKLGTDTPDASIFYIAYTLDGRDPAARPVTFFQDGGPGSSTVWLHLGSFGPKRLASNAPSTTTPMPFPLVDNAESLLDVSDLVFVDAVGTGFSQAIAPNMNQTFWGVDADAAVFRDFIRRYIAVNNRGTSPKFLFGESYGAARSAVLAYLLESAGVRLNGVVLQSSVMNYNTNCGVNEATTSCAGHLPSYGATGAWHGRTNPVPTTATFPTFIEQLRVLTTTQYAPAVNSYLTQRIVPAPALLDQLASATGLGMSHWQAHVNIGPSYFRGNLIPGTFLGRYDARMTTPAGGVRVDISDTFISPSFGTGISSYLVETLRYTAASLYTVVGNAISTWNYSHDGQPLPDTIPDLSAAMTLNPRLKVLAVSGYHDLATPFHQTERDLARLGANPNLLIRNYNGGHMTYLDDQSRALQKADLAQFYQLATQP
jgi:carboxypeptidase C (cathepsin A)